MFLIVGLGNPGEKYRHTRHNVGFDVIDKIVTQFPIIKFQLNKPLLAELVTIEMSEKKVVLAKPVTFMNESGRSVQKLRQMGELSITNELIVIHDDISMELGSIKISRGAGAGKHNGVQSIINHLGTNEFIRVRCGIGRGTGVLADVVLSRFTPDEKNIVDLMVRRAADAITAIVSRGVAHAMNICNTSVPNEYL